MMFARSRSWATWVFLPGIAASFSALGGENLWPVERLWIPEGTSSYAGEIDKLFYGILILTTIVFLVTEALLLYFVLRYRHVPGKKGYHTHGNHKLEMIWTITPAIILGIIALVQKSTWDEIKDAKHFPTGDDVVKVQLYAEQFTWNFRYPGPDGKFGTKDDIYTERMLTIPVNKKVVIEQTSKDVIHSLFLPYMRLKQDVVPGMQIKVWFDALKTTAQMREVRPKSTGRKPGGGLVEQDWDYPIVCAELCGINHYQMWGRVTVLEQPEYDKWVAAQSKLFVDGEKDVPDIWDKWKVDVATQERIYEHRAVPASQHHAGSGRDFFRFLARDNQGAGQ